MVEIADTVRKGKKVQVNQKDGITEEHGDMVERFPPDDRSTLVSAGLDSR